VTIAALTLLLACACAIAVRAHRRATRLQADLDGLRAGLRRQPGAPLPGREAFLDDVELELSRIARTGRPASLVVLGCDAAAIGDGRRSDAADAQATLVRVLRGSLRSIDLPYRIGTTEYAVILPETRAEGGRIAAARVSERVAAATGVTVTAGVAEAGPGIDGHELFRHAYCALLAAGREGQPAILGYSLELERSSSWTAGAPSAGVPPA
jgi:GGDEF domain-containing protein